MRRRRRGCAPPGAPDRVGSPLHPEDPRFGRRRSRTRTRSCAARTPTSGTCSTSPRASRLRGTTARSSRAYAGSALRRLTGARVEVTVGGPALGRRHAARARRAAWSGRSGSTVAMASAGQRLRDADRPAARERARFDDARRRGSQDAPRDDRRAVALGGGEGLLRGGPHREGVRHRGRPREAARLHGRRTSTRSRSARSCTTSARSGSPSRSCTSPAPSTTTSGS